MRILIFVVALVCGTTTLASETQFDLDMKFSVDGKLISSPRVITNEGELAIVEVGTEEGATHFEVLASDNQVDNEGNILLKLKVSRVLKDGTKKLISTPTIITRAGEEASISTVEGNQKSTLKVIANRRSL